MVLKWKLFVDVVVGKKLIKIPFSGHLRYDQFKKNLKSNNYVHQILEVLFNNLEGNLSSSLINVYHYITECYKEKFISAAGNSGLTFSGQIPTIETVSMMNDVGINISQLCILLRILRHTIGANFLNLK